METSLGVFVFPSNIFYGEYHFSLWLYFLSVPIEHTLKHDKIYSTVPTSGSQGGWIWRKKILKKQPVDLHEAKSLGCSLAVMPPGCRLHYLFGFELLCFTEGGVIISLITLQLKAQRSQVTCLIPHRYLVAAPKLESRVFHISALCTLHRAALATGRSRTGKIGVEGGHFTFSD